MENLHIGENATYTGVYLNLSIDGFSENLEKARQEGKTVREIVIKIGDIEKEYTLKEFIEILRSQLPTTPGESRE